MSIVRKIKRALRGEVDVKTATLEVLRRTKATLDQNRERKELGRTETPEVVLSGAFASLSPTELLSHFRTRSEPHFFPGFKNSSRIAELQRGTFPTETDELLTTAEEILTAHSWSILGLGTIDFGVDIDWNRDPVSGAKWPIEFHSDVNLFRGDGSDVRVLWELNRLGHFLTIARAYRVSGDERFADEFLRQLASWQAQNPYGYGANWNCAMEVALRAINLLGAFQGFVHSKTFDQQAISTLLSLLSQHGHFIRRNLEFSYVATSNHYLSDVVGLAWLGIMLPELEEAKAWREFGLREVLREMDKQVLPDGADYESSTGYHRFVLELFLYTFILCRENGIEFEKRYWEKLRAMVNYVRAYMRPDGRAPLIGDSDSGQVLPVRARDADDHAYIAAVGAVVFEDPGLLPMNTSIPEEVLWIVGEKGVREFERLTVATTAQGSVDFPNAGMYFLRSDDLSMSFNASSAGINGRGSHGHNDALSVEVSACGSAFIVDPGTYVYTANLHERNLFRSTRYHSSVEVDGEEQNRLNEQTPFVIGDEARPRVLCWESNDQFDLIIAEHYGYARLKNSITHRRTVIFNKRQRWWRIEDEFSGSGQHDFVARFHLNSGLKVSQPTSNSVSARDKNGARLLIHQVDPVGTIEFEDQFTSTNYYQKSPSVTARWRFQAEAPCKIRWVLVPICETDDESDVELRLSQAESYFSEEL